MNLMINNDDAHNYDTQDDELDHNFYPQLTFREVLTMLAVFDMMLLMNLMIIIMILKIKTRS